MKRLCAVALGLMALSSSFAETNVGVSIGIYQPGVYGRIDIGNSPPPLVINPRPIVIMQSPVREPLYLYVPPGHQKHWDKHCGEYDACGRPVYFVREEWVRDRYEESRGHGHGKKKKHYDDN